MRFWFFITFFKRSKFLIVKMYFGLFLDNDKVYSYQDIIFQEEWTLQMSVTKERNSFSLYIMPAMYFTPFHTTSYITSYMDVFMKKMSVEKEIFYFILHHYFEIVSLIEFTLIMFPPDLINLQFCSNIFWVSIFIFNNFLTF